MPGFTSASRPSEDNEAMSTDRWNRLSDWHNAWLNGDSAERRRLRDELTSKSPDLAAEADALAAASLSMTGFLETPAFVLTAAQLASDEGAMKPGTLVGPEGPVPNVGIRLVPAGAESVATEIDTAATISDSSGAFVFLGVPSGQYTLKVAKQLPLPAQPGTSTIIQSGSGTVTMSFSGSPGAAPPPLPEGDSLWASLALPVGTTDIGDLVVTLRPGARITGRVEFDGSTPPPSSDALQKLLISFEPADGGVRPFSVLRGRVGADGRVHVGELANGVDHGPGREVLAGDQLEPLTLPRQLTADQARYGGVGAVERSGVVKHSRGSPRSGQRAERGVRRRTACAALLSGCPGNRRCETGLLHHITDCSSHGHYSRGHICLSGL